MWQINFWIYFIQINNLFMLYIEASQINSNGGIVLLDLLLRKIQPKDISLTVYIGYEHVLNRLKYLESKNIHFVRTSLFKTLIRYVSRRERTLFLCNLPPFRRNLFSIIYIHNLFFAEKPKWTNIDSSIGLNLRKYLYYYWLKYFIRKVDVIACQTSEMAMQLKNTFGVSSSVLPFFEDFEKKNEEKKYDFFYPGSSAAHKNNNILLDAIEKSSQYAHFTVALTIGCKNSTLQNRINQINENAGYEIIHNFGTINHDAVLEIFSQSRALIFPSLKESFGLPLIEALQQKITVISSNMPYTFEVVRNPITFNPYDSSDISNCMLSFLKGEYKDIDQTMVVSNRIDELLDMLSEF